MTRRRSRTIGVTAVAMVAISLTTVGVVHVAGSGNESDEVLAALRVKVAHGELEAGVVDWLDTSGEFPAEQVRQTIEGLNAGQQKAFQVRLEQAGVRFFAGASKLGELWLPFQAEYDSAPPEARAAIVVRFVDLNKQGLPHLIKESQAVNDLLAEYGIVVP